MGIIALFMLPYYRLPGIIADFALLVYIAITYGIEGQVKRQAVLRTNPAWDEFTISEQRTGKKWRDNGFGAFTKLCSS